MEDNEIIKLYCERNEIAISETNKKYGKYCKSIAHNILENSMDTEECVNDTYLRVWNTIPPHKPNIFKVFLGRITRNLALDKYDSKTAKKRNTTADLIYEELEDCIASNDNINEAFSYKELVNEINNFLGKLTQEKRAIFLDRYWYFNSIKDISKKYGQKESSIKMNLLRTRNSLKEYLIERGEVV